MVQKQLTSGLLRLVDELATMYPHTLSSLGSGSSSSSSNNKYNNKKNKVSVVGDDRDHTSPSSVDNFPFQAGKYYIYDMS